MVSKTGSLVNAYHLFVEGKWHLIDEINEAVQGVRHPERPSPFLNLAERDAGLGDPVRDVDLMQLHQLNEPKAAPGTQPTALIIDLHNLIDGKEEPCLG